jgi:hydrogenase maturation protease
MKQLILALGNPILSDDAIAHQIADRLEEKLNGVDIIKSSAATMDLVGRIADYDRLVVIDAIKTGSVAVGTVHRFGLDELTDTIRASCPHDINFATAFEMARKWGYAIPADIRIYGIEVEELAKFSEELTPQLAQKLDEITARILGELTEWF